MKTVVGQRQLGVGQHLALGFQHLFAMFGATVLVPLLTGFDPAVALFTSGSGTLLFILITQGKVPAYLGSSFAFIARPSSASLPSGAPNTPWAGEWQWDWCTQWWPYL